MKPITYLCLLGGIWCFTLAARGDEVDDLLKQLKVANGVEAKLELIDEIAKKGAEAKAAVDPLLTIVNNTKETSKPLKRAAIRALGAIGPDAKKSAMALTTLFKGDGELRAECGQALGKIGGTLAVSRLLEFSAPTGPDKKAQDVGLRTAAINTIGDIGPDAKSVLKSKVFLGMLTDKDANVKMATIRALGKIGPDAKDQIPELLEMCRDGNAGIKLAAMEAVGRIGTESKPSRPSASWSTIPTATSPTRRSRG